MVLTFKERLSFDERKRQAEIVLEKYPDKIPVIVEKDPKSKKIPNIDRCKFLVPRDFSVAQLLYVIRKRIEISSDEGIFFFVNNQLVTSSSLLADMYDKHKDDDAFLYIIFAGQNVFG